MTNMVKGISSNYWVDPSKKIKRLKETETNFIFGIYFCQLCTSIIEFWISIGVVKNSTFTRTQLWTEQMFLLLFNLQGPHFIAMQWFNKNITERDVVKQNKIKCKKLRNRSLLWPWSIKPKEVRRNVINRTKRKTVFIRWF